MRRSTLFALGLPVILLIALLGHAQDFEAASVRAEPAQAPGQAIGMGMSGGPGSTDPTRVRFSNFTLHDLISSAYDVGGGQVSGPADWTSEQRYEVIATLAKDTTEQQFHVMLRHLLADRFELTIRRESRTMNVYSLTIANGGPKLHKPAPDEVPSPENTEVQGARKVTRDKAGYPVIPTAQSSVAVIGDHGRWHGHSEATSYIAKLLSFQLRTPVQDDTGLTGIYDFTVSWILPRPGSTPTENDDSGPSLFAAIEEQLGLKLVSKKGPVEILIIDHAQKPSGN